MLFFFQIRPIYCFILPLLNFFTDLEYVSKETSTYLHFDTELVFNVFSVFDQQWYSEVRQEACVYFVWMNSNNLFKGVHFRYQLLCSRVVCLGDIPKADWSHIRLKQTAYFRIFRVSFPSPVTIKWFLVTQLYLQTGQELS